MVGDIIPLRWATSSRFGGRLGQESAVFGEITGFNELARDRSEEIVGTTRPR
jgi:hypothetical protein